MQRQLPMAGDVTLVSRMTGLLLPLLAGSAIAGLTLGPRGWSDTAAATYPALLGQDAITLLVGYSYSFYVLGARITWLFPVYIAVVSLGRYGALALLFGLDLRALAAHAGPRLPRRAIVICFVVTASFFAGLVAPTVSAVETAAYAAGFTIAAVLLSRYLASTEEEQPCIPAPS